MDLPLPLPGERVGCGVLRPNVHGVSDPFSIERAAELTVDNVTLVSTTSTPGTVARGQSVLIVWTTHGEYIENVDVSMDLVTITFEKIFYVPSQFTSFIKARNRTSSLAASTI